MKAAIRTGFLGYTFTFSQNVAIPSFQPDSSQHKHSVFIKVQSAAINPVDYKLPRFIIGPIIGRDFCGVVEKVGSQVTSLKVGDQVYGNSSTGSLAEYAIAQETTIAKKEDDHWTTAECAALPVAYQSALQSFQVGNIIPKGFKGESVEKDVLIIGASGGCGVAGIQLCKAAGVKRIVAICSKKNTDFVKGIGATQVVNYDVPDELNNFFQQNKGQFDCVYDAATGSGGNEDYWKQSISLLKPKIGQFVALNGPFVQEDAPAAPVYPYSQIMAAYRGALEAVQFEEDYDELEDEKQTEINGVARNHTKAFQRILNHFFGDYFKEDADEEMASDMSERWGAFARSSNPNYDGSKATWLPWRHKSENSTFFNDDSLDRFWSPRENNDWSEDYFDFSEDEYWD